MEFNKCLELVINSTTSGTKMTRKSWNDGTYVSLCGKNRLVITRFNDRAYDRFYNPTPIDSAASDWVVI